MNNVRTQKGGKQKEKFERRMKLLEEGLTAKEIAEKEGISFRSIQAWVNYNKIDLESAKKSGDGVKASAPTRTLEFEAVTEAFNDQIQKLDEQIKKNIWEIRKLEKDLKDKKELIATLESKKSALAKYKDRAKTLKEQKHAILKDLGKPIEIVDEQVIYHNPSREITLRRDEFTVKEVRKIVSNYYNGNAVVMADAYIKHLIQKGILERNGERFKVKTVKCNTEYRKASIKELREAGLIR